MFKLGGLAVLPENGRKQSDHFLRKTRSKMPGSRKNNAGSIQINPEEVYTVSVSAS